MPFITAQKSAQYYNDYRSIQVTLTKDVAKVTGFQASQIYLKCAGDQYPCLIYSTSMENSRLIMKIDSVFMDKMTSVNNVASLRFCFIESDEKEKLVSFYVPGKIGGYSEYKNSKQSNLYIVNFDFSKRPADDLIATLGKLLEVNISSKKRQEVRLDVDDELLKDLAVQSKSVRLEIDGIPRMGVLRDISFGGAKVIISGLAKFLVEKKIVLNLQTDLEIRHIRLSGIIKRWDKVEGRKDIVIIAIQFNENVLPMCLKSKINDAMEKRGY